MHMGEGQHARADFGFKARATNEETTRTLLNLAVVSASREEASLSPYGSLLEQLLREAWKQFFQNLLAARQ
jgi:hypothetical protein